MKNQWVSKNVQNIEKIGNYANASGAIVASRLLCSDAMPSFDEVQGLVSGVLSW